MQKDQNIKFDIVPFPFQNDLIQSPNSDFKGSSVTNEYEYRHTYIDTIARVYPQLYPIGLYIFGLGKLFCCEEIDMVV